MGALKKVWLNKGGVATILPLKELEKLWHVVYDSRRHRGTSVLHTDAGNIVLKNNNNKSMPYLDLKEFEAEAALSLVQTVRGNMEGFTKREVEEARKACGVQEILGHPTNHNFLGMVRGGMISNCLVTPTAVQNIHQIFGPDLAGIRGRMVWRPPDSVTTNYVQIPRVILKRHQLVTLLAVDIMFVNGVPFLFSVARGLNLVTTKFTPSRMAKQLAASITRMMDLYARKGFQVGTVLMDNKLEKLQNLVPIRAVNTTAAKEHVPEVEPKIRLIKKRGRGILNTLPFKRMPRLMLIELVYHVVLWLNAFPEKSGVSDTLSPREIVYWHKLDFAKHCKLPSGMYCEVHDEPAPTNTMVTRSTPAIVIGPTSNLQGTYKFFSLAMGKKVKRCTFTLYPMSDPVIKKVEAYAKTTALPGIFDFADRHGILFEWNKEVDESPKGVVEVEDVILHPSLAAEHPGVALEQDQPLPSIKEELVLQGRAKDAAACNANLQPLNVAGVGATLPFVHANVAKLDDYKSDNNNSIIAMADIPQQPPHAPFVVNNTDNNNDVGSDDNADDTESNNEESNDDKPSGLAKATDLDGNKPDKN